jgi:hypothetical protein
VLSGTSEQQRDEHRLRGRTGVGSPLTVYGQQRRRILCNSANGRLDLFFLAGMQDKQKRPSGLSRRAFVRRISTELRSTRRQLRCLALPSGLPLPRG